MQLTEKESKWLVIITPYVLARVEQGEGMGTAIKNGINDYSDTLKECAEGKTERVKKAMERMCIRVYRDLNKRNEVKYCICIFEPRGECGLEGYVLDKKYKYERLEKDKNGHPYYRLYIDGDYYETCSPRTFNKYFQKEQIK